LHLSQQDLPCFQYALHAQKNEIVHFDAFCKLVDSFWPVDETFLQRISELLTLPFVRLHWSGEKVLQKLHGRSNGTFLLRFSEKSGAAFTLTLVKGDQKISQGHQVCVRIRVYRENDPAARTIVFKLGHRSFADRIFDSIEDIVEGDVGRALGLVNPISTSEWIPPAQRFSLPPPKDTSAGRPGPSNPGPATDWRDHHIPQPEHYTFFDDFIFSQSLAELPPDQAIDRAIRKNQTMSPERRDHDHDP
ncbi:MAG: SH2 domain-containing protein, partial [archaeon]|nr:SH2 domain-containing protein [archaeon]